MTDITTEETIEQIEGWLAGTLTPFKIMPFEEGNATERDIRTLIAVARTATEDGWRTMESVPKDGTPVLFIDRYGHTSDVVHWRPPFVNYGTQIPGRFVNREGRGMDTRDYADWVFWNLAPALPATEEPPK